MEFPRWMYRQDVEKGRLFSTAKELDDAGEGWFDSPAFLHSVPDATGSTQEPEDHQAEDSQRLPPMRRGPGRPRKVTDANIHTA